MESIKSTKVILNQSNNGDEHHTLHTKLLSNSIGMDETDLINVNKTDQSICSLDDFTGGPIYNNQSSEIQVKQHSCDTEQNRSITTTPADSSGGFHNTLSVLESHLNKNKFPNLSQQQIEYLLLHRKDVAIHNNSYIDIPIDNNQRLPFVGDNFTNKKCDSHMGVGNLSNSFELELEAFDRLQSMLDKDIPSDNFESASSADLHLTSTQTEGENVLKSDEYIYHIARSRNGQLYLRVRRNSCLEQGIDLMCVFLLVKIFCIDSDS